jgi:hypothetical protein
MIRRHWAAALLLAAVAFGCGNSDVLMINDFETARDLDCLKWRCHYWLEQTTEFATSGAHGLKMEFPAGEYPTVELWKVPRDWRGYTWFEADLWAPDLQGETLMIRIDDRGDATAFADRFELAVPLTGAPQHVRVPLDRIARGNGGRPQNLGAMRRILFYFGRTDRRVTLYLDGVKLTR